MSFLKKILRNKPKEQPSASIAKERLQIIVSHERMQRKSPDFLPLLQQELVDVIAKYVEIDKEQVKVALEQVGDKSVLELNIALPEIAAQAGATVGVKTKLKDTQAKEIA